MWKWSLCLFYPCRVYEINLKKLFERPTYIRFYSFKNLFENYWKGVIFSLCFDSRKTENLSLLPWILWVSWTFTLLIVSLMAPQSISKVDDEWWLISLFPILNLGRVLFSRTGTLESNLRVFPLCKPYFRYRVLLP